MAAGLLWRNSVFNQNLNSKVIISPLMKRRRRGAASFSKGAQFFCAVWFFATPLRAASLSGNLPGVVKLLGSPYVATNIVVPAGQTVVIEAGVTVQMADGASLNVDGTLQAIGTAAA